MPLPSSSNRPLRPTPLLALVCAAVASAYDPSWLARPVSALAGTEGIRADRVSRLWHRVCGKMEDLVAAASRRGRKKKRRRSKRERRILRTEALLEVAREVIRLNGAKKRRAQDFLVAARQRLAAEQGIHCSEFAAALGISERSMRYWAARGVAAPKEEEVEDPPPPPRDRNVGRFDLEHTLPGLQAMGDTTNVEILGVPLKVVALQDPGRRHQELWEGFAVETEENHEVIVKLLTEILAKDPGLQFLCDQGTPYMAKETQAACDELDLFHEPQKEGTPTEKPTLERSFLTVKSCLAPLLALTNKIAGLLPALAHPDLAKALGKLLLGTFLNVYVIAARVPQTNRSDDPEVLERIAREQREKAVAERRSARLFLGHLFDRYQFEGARQTFVNTLKDSRVEDLEEAERRYRRQLLKVEVRHHALYFAGILENVVQERQPLRERQRELQRRAKEAKDAEERARRQQKAHEEALANHPEHKIAEGLSTIATQRTPGRARLAMRGVGHGTRQLREALETIARESPGSLRTRAECGWKIFVKEPPEPAILELVRKVFEDYVAAAERETPCPEGTVADTLWPGSRTNETERPPPGPDLRNSSARSGST